jgi:23S rRNA (cytosine1962-C5)-methyltransferase
MTELSAEALPVLRLRRHEDKRLRAGHLWVYSNEVDTEATPLAAFEPGAVVQVRTSRDQFVGLATLNPHALICARLYTREPGQALDAGFLEARLRRALALRERLYADRCYRLVFGESDGLPGLVLDRFGDLLVGQLSTLGMERLRPQLEAAIRNVLAPATLVWKNDSSARDLEQLPHAVEVAWGELPAEVQVKEQGLTMTAPLAAGQKTGWFYDQAANREQMVRLMPRGARVLDVCSYVGAWALVALRQGAAAADCVDASQAALDAAQRNAAANGLTVGTHRGDAFEVLAALAAQGQRYDVVVVDPPAFIKRRKDLPQGEAAYRKLNALAMRLLADDGLLVSCSCSFHLPAGSLPELLQSAAQVANRELQLLAFGGQGPDHPMHPAIPETRYLKAVFARVTR